MGSPTPPACQYESQPRCEAPVFAVLTFRSQTGFVWMEAVCQGHGESRTRQVQNPERQIKGTLTRVRVIGSAPVPTLEQAVREVSNASIEIEAADEVPDGDL